MAKVVSLKDKKITRNKKKELEEKVNEKASYYNNRYPTKEELQELSSIDVNTLQSLLTHSDRLVHLRKVLFNALPIAEGLFYKKPSQSTAYALTNIINSIQEISENLEKSINWDDLRDEIIEVVIKPRFERLILSLGRNIRIILNKDDKSINLEKELNKLFKRIGQQAQEILEEIPQAIFEIFAKYQK